MTTTTTPVVALPLAARIRNLKFRRMANKAKINTLTVELETAVTDRENQLIELDELQAEVEKELGI
jgi:hypothetical protein